MLWLVIVCDYILWNIKLVVQFCDHLGISCFTIPYGSSKKTKPTTDNTNSTPKTPKTPRKPKGTPMAKDLPTPTRRSARLAK